MWTLRALIVICLYLGVRGLGIAWTTLSQLEMYRASQTAGPPMLRITINAALGASFCALAIKLYRRNQRALHTLPALVMIHALFAFFWLANYAQASFDRGRLGFAAVTSALGVGFVLWLWLRLRKNLRRTS
jgi:hypothetical protein